MIRLLAFPAILSGLVLLCACTTETKAPEETLLPAEGTGRSLDIGPRPPSESDAEATTATAVE